MNAKISVFIICAEAIIYLLLYNLHDSTFKTLLVSNGKNAATVFPICIKHRKKLAIEIQVSQVLDDFFPFLTSF